jgi:hypothetical protein
LIGDAAGSDCDCCAGGFDGGTCGTAAGCAEGALSDLAGTIAGAVVCAAGSGDAPAVPPARPRILAISAAIAPFSSILQEPEPVALLYLNTGLSAGHLQLYREPICVQVPPAIPHACSCVGFAAAGCAGVRKKTASNTHELKRNLFLLDIAKLLPQFPRMRE